MLRQLGFPHLPIDLFLHVFWRASAISIFGNGVQLSILLSILMADVLVIGVVASHLIVVICLLVYQWKADVVLKFGDSEVYLDIVLELFCVVDLVE